jgi:hypothetical protein
VHRIPRERHILFAVSESFVQPFNRVGNAGQRPARVERTNVYPTRAGRCPSG